jgi:hypothetical protein
MNLSQEVRRAVKFVVAIDLVVSVALTCIVCRVMAILSARVCLTKEKTAASTSGYLPLFGHVKLLVATLRENVETRSFLHRRTFASLLIQLYVLKLCPCVPLRI